MIFGLYEAYITKILWLPTWHSMLRVGGIGVTEVIILAFWWHPLMSFIIPIMVGEAQFCGSADSIRGMPARVRAVLLSPLRRRRWLVAAALVLGLFHSANTPSPLVSFTSVFSSVGFLLLLGLLWRRLARGRAYAMADLLPGGLATGLLAVPLLGIYVLFGFKLRPKALPGLGPQAAVWALYLVIISALILSLRKSRRTSPEPLGAEAPRLRWPALLALAFCFAAASAASKLCLGKNSLVMILPGWLFGGLLGLFLLWYALRDLAPSRKGQTTERTERT